MKTANSVFDQFRAAFLDLITRRRERLQARLQQDPDLEASLEDLELVDKTRPAEQDAIGESYKGALEEFGSGEEAFAQFADVAGLVVGLQIEPVRVCLREGLRVARNAGQAAHGHAA